MLKCWAYDLGMANINYGNRFLEACNRMMSEEMATNFPYYPIQSICEQADYCLSDKNTLRLQELIRSAEQHKDKYTSIDYGFVHEYLWEIMEKIKDANRGDKARREIEDY